MSKAKQFSKKQAPLTPSIFYILLSLATIERHGYDIMKQVESDSQGKIKLGAGTLYGAIKRLLEEKLIIEIDSPHARRKYYQLTEKGRGIFLNELQRYNEAVELAKKKNIFSLPIVTKLAYVYA
jgi:DNA-binding PadR family transcriptional regulator